MRVAALLASTVEAAQPDASLRVYGADSAGARVSAVAGSVRLLAVSASFAWRLMGRVATSLLARQLLGTADDEALKCAAMRACCGRRRQSLAAADDEASSLLVPP
jgi:hypothetical protein